MKPSRSFKEFLIESFQDDRGRVDGKLMTMFGSFAMLIIAAIVYMVTAFWYGEKNAVSLPEFMWGTFAGIVLFGIGAGAYMFHEATKVDRTRIIEKTRAYQECAPDPYYNLYGPARGPIDGLREENRNIHGDLSQKKPVRKREEEFEQEPEDYI